MLNNNKLDLMDPFGWGSHAWTFMHSITFNYPQNPTQKDKERTHNFFHSLKYILPCADCRKHYKKTIEQDMPIEPHLESRETLSKWLVDFHNNVNERLGKPKQPYDLVREKYESMRGRCQINIISDTKCPSAPKCESTTNTKKTNKKTQILLFIVIFILILLLMMGTYGYQCLSNSFKKKIKIK